MRGEVDEYEVRDAETDELVTSGAVQGFSGVGVDTISIVDITDLDVGRYYVEFPGHGRSIDFSVAESVYDDAFLLAMVAFYGWRSGIDISFQHRGVTFEHAAGHLDDGLLDYVGSEGETQDGTGGWYDAGDYGKYVINGAFAVGQLLFAWDHFEDNLAELTLPIPESGGDLPDFLAEVRFELEWLLKMQIATGPDEGAVYEKLTPTSFTGFLLPADDPKARYFVPHGSTATASFAAAMAHGARVFRAYDEEFADQMEGAAVLAWTWLEANPDHLPADTTGFSTGNYGSDDEDERLWAAAELFETTGEAAYLTAVEESISARTRITDLSWDWPKVGNLGIFAFATSSQPGRDPDLVAAVETDLRLVAQQLGTNGSYDPYGRAEPYYWGSNGSTVRNCMTLQVAHLLEPNEAFLDTCTEQLGHVFGRNEYNRSQVTGFGIDPPLKPHHRISGGDDVVLPYPGLLVGGADLEGNWSDEQNSYSTNEVAINWNAALVYALAGFTSGDPLVYDGSEEGTMGSIAGPPPPPPPPILDLIDDLEDGDLDIIEEGGRNGSWYTSSDETGDSVALENTDDAAHEGERSVSAVGSGYTSWGAGLGLTFVTDGGSLLPYDASIYTGFTFWVKANQGAGRAMRVLVRDTQTDPVGGQCEDCYDHFMKHVDLTGEWQQVHVRFAEIRQQGFGDKFPAIDLTELVGIEFQTPANVDLDVRIDEIGFVDENAPVVDEGAGGMGGGAPGASALPIVDDGCGCRVTGTARHGRWPTGILSALLALGWMWRRRQAR